MNILILAAGTRNKIVQYFKRDLTGMGKVIATDVSLLAPAIYEADSFCTVPMINEPGYIDLILDICKEEKVDGVLSLIDPELGLLAENTDRFREVGTTVIGSSADACDMALDKFRMFKWLKSHGYKCARSWMDK
nr:carbamoyl phosphate synthase [Clostridia bacterium]